MSYVSFSVPLTWQICYLNTRCAAGAVQSKQDIVASSKTKIMSQEWTRHRLQTCYARAEGPSFDFPVFVHKRNRFNATCSRAKTVSEGSAHLDSLTWKDPVLFFLGSRLKTYHAIETLVGIILFSRLVNNAVNCRLLLSEKWKQLYEYQDNPEVRINQVALEPSGYTL